MLEAARLEVLVDPKYFADHSDGGSDGDGESFTLPLPLPLTPTPNPHA